MGGSITMISFGESRGYDPVLLGGFASGDAPAASSIFDTLMRWDETAQKVVPQLALSMTSTDSTVWTMKLRPNVKFTDNTPFDAAAVVFNIKRLQDPANKAAFGAGPAGTIASMDTPDATTIVFTLKNPAPLFPVNFTNRLAFVGSPTAITALGKDFASKPVGAGPFMFKEWVRDDHLTLVKNPNYWNAPRPYLDSITFKPVPDIQQRRNSLDAGEAQITYAVDGETIDIYKGKGWQFATVALNGGEGLMFNTKKAPFDDVNVRRAIAEAIKPDDYNNIIYNGHANMGRTIFVKDSPFLSTATQPPSYNPDNAKKLFDAYKASHGGTLAFTYSSFQSSSSQALGQFLQSVLKPYGVDVTIKVGDTSATVADVFGGSYQVTNWGLNLGGEPEPQITNFFSTGSTGNYMGFSNADVDAGLKTAASSTDPAVRKTGYAQVQKGINEQLPYLVMIQPKEGNVISPKVGGVRLSSNSVLLTDELTINP